MDIAVVTQYVARVLVFLTAIPFHEAAHAFVSDKLGDPTARNLGRLSLNPLRHVDPFGFLMMLFVGIGWAKPVPIDTRYYENRKRGMALSAAAGPLSNLLLALVHMVVFKLFLLLVPITSTFVSAVGTVLYLMVGINITLAIFNMLPIPPFDGSRIFLVFLPDRLYFNAMRYERYIGFAVLALVFLGVLDTPLIALNSGLMRGLDVVTGFMGRLY